MKTITSKILVFSVIVLFIGAGFIPSSSSDEPVFATTIYVGGSGPGNYSSIQDAIDYASNGDTIFVYNGNYTENIKINKSINLVGENKNTTIIEKDINNHVVRVTADFVNISNLHIRNGGNDYNGIYCMAEYCTILQCKISDNEFGFSSTQYVNHDGILIQNCDIYDNDIGIDLIDSNFTVMDCDIHHNMHSLGAIWVMYSSGTINNCNIHSNDVGMRLGYDSNCDIFNNYIDNNEKHGISFEGESNNSVYHNTISNTQYYCGINLFFADGSPNIKIHHNNLLNNDFYNAMDYGYATWDNGYPSGGNYWSDYDDGDTDGDGIGDSPYYIEGNDSQDNYPLMYPDWYITTLSQNWNFISLNLNESYLKDKLILCSGCQEYNWTEAVNSDMVSDSLFGWNSSMQAYSFATKLEPGNGYWIYCYQPCEMWIRGLNITYDDYITDVEQKWNIISIPYDQPVAKTEILVNNMSWNDAVSSGLISDFAFGWNRTAQSYTFADNFEPSYCYWIYAYQPCALKRAD